MYGMLKEFCSGDNPQRRQYVLDYLSGLGLNPLRQEFQVDEFRFTNILVTNRPINGSRIPAISAHYDRTEEGDGAVDNGAAVIEMLSALEDIVKNDIRNPFGFIFFDGEEFNLQGSKYFVNNPVMGLSKVYNVDTSAFGDHIYASTYSYDDIKETRLPSDPRMNLAARYVCDTLEVPFLQGGNGKSDDHALKKAGIPSTHLCTVTPDIGLTLLGTDMRLLDAEELFGINGPEDMVGRVEPSTLEMMKKFMLDLIGYETSKQKPIIAQYFRLKEITSRVCC